MSSVPLKVSWVPYQRRQFNFIDGTIAEIKLDSGWDYCTKCKIKEWKCHRGIAWWICDNHFEKNPFSIFFFWRIHLIWMIYCRCWVNLVCIKSYYCGSSACLPAFRADFVHSISYLWPMCPTIIGAMYPNWVILIWPTSKFAVWPFQVKRWASSSIEFLNYDLMTCINRYSIDERGYHI